jgi:hypothetical protein
VTGEPSDPSNIPPARNLPSDPPRDAKRRTRAWIGIVALAAVTAAVGVGILIRGGGGRSPEETVIAYFQAYDEGDCETMAELSTTDPGRGIDICRSVMRTEQDEHLTTVLDDVEIASEGDETVLVTYTRTDVTSEDEDIPGEITLVREAGIWRITSITEG